MAGTRESRPALLLDLGPLRRNPAYARLWIGGVTSGVGAQLTIVAVGIRIYDLTHSTFAVSLVGGCALAPMLVVGLVGGAVVDAFDRRRVLLLTAVLSWASTAAIAVFAWSGSTALPLLYLLTTLQASSSTLVGTARFTVLPRVVEPEELPAAAALSGVSAGLQATLGPALAGLLVAGVGVPWTITVDVLLYTTALAGIVTLPPIRPEGEAVRPGPAAILEGLRYLVRSSAIRGSYLAQVAVTALARPTVLYPAIGTSVVGGGPTTVGVLGSAVAVGSLASGFVSGPITRIRRRGLAIGVATAVQAVAIVGLGLVLLAVDPVGRLLAGGPRQGVDPLALGACAVLLAVSGAADDVSNILRTTVLQTAVPDAIRGRLQGLFTLVLTAGPRLGDVVAGSITALGVLWLAPAAGGVAAALAVAVLLARSVGFRRFRAGQEAA